MFLLVVFAGFFFCFLVSEKFSKHAKTGAFLLCVLVAEITDLFCFLYEPFASLTSLFSHISNMRM